MCHQVSQLTAIFHVMKCKPDPYRPKFSYLTVF